MDDWIAQLEDQTRKFPREAILISFLLGALLQIFAGHALLIRLVLKVVSPIVLSPLPRLATIPGSP
jgi:predicted alpha/beta hydrolase family esterase